MTRRTSEHIGSSSPSRTTSTGLAALATVEAAIGQIPANAQEAPTASALQEITVTARRREESIQDVPIAVTAISGAALDRAGTADIGELAQVVPSVTL